MRAAEFVTEGSSESVSLRDMVNVVDRHYPKYYAELSGSDISDKQFERAIVNAYKKIMQKQGVAEEVNPDITSGEKYFSGPTPNVRMGDFIFNASLDSGGYRDPNAKGLKITAYDPKNFRKIGWVDFIVHKDKKGNTWLESDETEVDDRYQRKGVATMMYAYAKSLGNDIKPSDLQSNSGIKMWKKWGSDAAHLVGEQGVAEEVNPEILSTKNSLPTENITMGDYEFNARIYTGELGNPGLQIRAYDPKKPQNQLIGHADFIVLTDKKGNTWLESDDTSVNPSHQGKGVAAMMYAFAKSLGNDIKPSDIQEPPGEKMWKKWGKDAKNLVGEQGVAEGTTVTRIDSNPITGFGSSLKAYKHTDDWSQSGVDTGDDSYWKNKNLKTNTTKGLFAGDPRRTALYATGNAHETRYVEFTQNGQPIVYFDQKDLPAMRSRKTYLTVFDANDFKQLPTGEWFSENPGKPIKQVPIGDPFKYIASQGWIVRVTDDLDKVFKQVKNMHKAGKIAQDGAEGMNESKQGVAENFADGRNPQDKGDAKRHGINTKASVSSLRKTAKQGGRKGQLAHWLANMKSGRAKAKKK